jgi:uncharacterized damage-inducible protein DinB
MASTQSTPIAHTLIGEVEQEMANTRKLLERVPMEKADWKPHVKSGTLAWLAGHCAIMPGWGFTTLTETGLDIAGVDSAVPKFTSREQLLEHFDGELKKFRAALEAATDEQLMTPWTLRAGEHMIFSMPRVAVLRGMVMNHMIHHRGELMVYLRLLDVPLPSMYGPTADEK